jgi:hypothetical protein
MTRNNDLIGCMKIAGNFYDDMLPPKIVANECNEQRIRPSMGTRRSSATDLDIIEVASRPLMMMRWRSSGANIGGVGRRAPISTRRVRFSEGDIKVECNYEYLERADMKAIWYRVR